MACLDLFLFIVCRSGDPGARQGVPQHVVVCVDIAADGRLRSVVVVPGKPNLDTTGICRTGRLQTGTVPCYATAPVPVGKFCGKLGGARLSVE